ncbi:hypothetical protein EVG20_g9491 [Dentipellis fragilis]|uniref:Uncharacterized protein n=1 Tax=Dentipellis fragilis TaxID=205917 RepID=A0A4Y9XYU5_9AGAM|nr:hypothetical protein EVG20_g9491 [Dentipellis fragilis]
MPVELDPAQRRDEVHALLKLIASSANDAVAIWERNAGSVPSLDEAKVDGRCASNTDLLRAVRLLEGASYQLCSTLSPTFLTLHTSTPVEAACLRVAVEAKIPGILADHPNGLHVTEIAKRIGLPSAKLSRILRILSVKHCFREGRFHLTTSHATNSLQRFGRAMTALRLGAVHELYPIGSLPANTTWCDVGGGMGGMLLPIAQTHPHIQLTLQDQPHVLEEAKDHFEQHCPTALRENRISFVPVDFLKGSPVPDQDFYYMRMIVHDWPDPACVQILTNIRKVMKPSSRLLIPHSTRNVEEYVLIDSVAEITDTGAGLPGAIDAPKPLPRNYGAGGIRPFIMDLNMMVLNNSRERSLGDIISLGNRAGLEFVKFWDCVEMSIVELKAT